MRTAGLAALACLTACASSGQFADRIGRIYVADVEGDPQILCDAGELSIGHAEAVAFFRRAAVIDYRSFDDNYPYTTCRVLGTLQYDGKPCNWWISVAATAVVTCNGVKTYFACENCKDLVNTEQCPPQKSCKCPP
ncbi:MAG: hypothetical protein RL701_1720 [Pseudomonadota bacterium]